MTIHVAAPALDALLDTPLAAGTKGLPFAAAGTPLRSLGSLGLGLLQEDLPMPVAVLREERVRHNLDWMMRFCRRAGVELAPHGKTTMAPQLFHLQLQAGAWGITAATGAHVAVYRQFGIQRILLANQLVDRPSIRLVLDHLRDDPSFEFLCLVDSVESVERLAGVIAAEAPVGRPLEVLVEMGAPGMRTGARTIQDAALVAKAVAAHAGRLALRGVETFEGLLMPDDEGVRVGALLDDVAAVAAQVAPLVAEGPMILTAGGSFHFDLAAARLSQVDPGRPTTVVLRSGCSITSDAGAFGRGFETMHRRSDAVAEGGEGLLPALEVWAMVQSRPDPDLALATAGRRDVSFDMSLPVLQQWLRP